MTIKRFAEFTPDIHNTAYVDDDAYVSGRTTIGADSSIWPMAVLRGDVNDITIGERTNVQDGSVLHVAHDNKDHGVKGFPLIIGDDVTVGHNATLHACTIGNRCLIGMGATVLDGAVIEDETIIGAGSLVTPGKTLESGFLWMGSPAKKARALTDDEKTFLLYSAKSYVALANRTRESAE
jgi:carbonic anhydrase/acetyltransferase-like protein (isoleucine patch superfamily)